MPSSFKAQIQKSQEINPRSTELEILKNKNKALEEIKTAQDIKIRELESLLASERYKNQNQNNRSENQEISQTLKLKENQLNTLTQKHDELLDQHLSLLRQFKGIARKLKSIDPSFTPSTESEEMMIDEVFTKCFLYLDQFQKSQNKMQTGNNSESDFKESNIVLNRIMYEVENLKAVLTKNKQEKGKFEYNVMISSIRDFFKQIERYKVMMKQNN